MIKLTMLLLLLLASCSTMSGEWSAWKITDVAQNKRQWKFCTQELHGNEYHHKGLCYDSQECRHRKTLFGRKKSECRDTMLFCTWGDITCMVKFDLLDNVIIDKE